MFDLVLVPHLTQYCYYYSRCLTQSHLKKKIISRREEEFIYLPKDIAQGTGLNDGCHLQLPISHTHLQKPLYALPYVNLKNKMTKKKGKSFPYKNLGQTLSHTHTLFLSLACTIHHQHLSIPVLTPCINISKNTCNTNSHTCATCSAHKVPRDTFSPNSCHSGVQ